MSSELECKKCGELVEVDDPVDPTTPKINIRCPQCLEWIRKSVNIIVTSDMITMRASAEVPKNPSPPSNPH